MSALIGIVGAGALFALLGFAATRVGSRLEGVAGCHADPNSLESCTFGEGCDGCSEETSASGWWPDDKVTYGDRR